MFRHRIPEYIPDHLPWAGKKTKLTVRSESDTPVPPEEGRNYKKNPKNDSDADGFQRDKYFYEQLRTLYNGKEFERGNLDAGRLNRLWCLDVLVPMPVAEDVRSKRHQDKFRLDVNRGSEHFGS